MAQWDSASAFKLPWTKSRTAPGEVGARRRGRMTQASGWKRWIDVILGRSIEDGGEDPDIRAPSPAGPSGAPQPDVLGMTLKCPPVAAAPQPQPGLAFSSRRGAKPSSHWASFPEQPCNSRPIACAPPPGSADVGEEQGYRVPKISQWNATTELTPLAWTPILHRLIP